MTNTTGIPFWHGSTWSMTVINTINGQWECGSLPSDLQIPASGSTLTGPQAIKQNQDLRPSQITRTCSSFQNILQLIMALFVYLFDPVFIKMFLFPLLFYTVLNILIWNLNFCIPFCTQFYV